MPMFKMRKAERRPRNARSDHPRVPGAIQITLSGSTVQKILKLLLPPASCLPQDSQQQEHSLRPTLRPWIGIIDQIARDEAALPKKMQTTAMSILKRLREEYGYTGGYSMVQEYVYDARTAANPAFHGRKSLNKRTRKPTAEAVAPPRNASASITPTNQEELPIAVPRSVVDTFRLSQHPQRKHVPENQVFQWLRTVLQGAMPLNVLANEMSDVPLPELEVLLESSTKGTLSMRNRSMAILGYLRGISAAPICSFLKISTGSLFRYWRLYRSGGTTALFTRRPRSDKKSNNESIKSAVFALLHSPPAAHGINRTTWRMADLRRILGDELNDAISCDTIHTIIKEAGWKWRHARVVLTSNDPDYRVKVDAIKKILSELKPDEAFFSIDEYGPFAIKKKGGVKQVAPGDLYVVPQWQKSKGWLILTAAIELSRNQVTHFYSRKKNTDEMIKMADHLRTQYRSCSTIYLSWDAASWHVSKDLVAHLEKINQQAIEEGYPVVKTAPLPACAQFLNVIESVFSGMARAIIHNSDYPSVEAAMDAIDRYIRERNEYFSAHPKKAGQKIWGKERVPSLFAEDQNCKDPLYQFPFEGWTNRNPQRNRQGQAG